MFALSQSPCVVDAGARLMTSANCKQPLGGVQRVHHRVETDEPAALGLDKGIDSELSFYKRLSGD